MAKFCGVIGYEITDESAENIGIWNPMVIERTYFGDITRNTRRLQFGDKANGDVIVSNEISIVADPFAYENFHNIRYVEFMGARRRVDAVEVQYPRLILTLGDVYNGE